MRAAGTSPKLLGASCELSVELASGARVLQPPDLLLYVLDLLLDAPHLMRDLLGALAVAGLLRVLKRVLELPKFLLKPRELMTKLSELSAVAIVGRPILRRSLARLRAARRLSASRRLSRLSWS
jgi:hypothetical protein